MAFSVGTARNFFEASIDQDYLVRLLRIQLDKGLLMPLLASTEQIENELEK